MKTIYENTIKTKGPMAENFLDEKMIILFGEKAPQELKDYCYLIDVVEPAGEIQTGQALYIGNKVFKITSVGDLVQRNLAALGHITLRFDGASTPELPGTLYLEDKEVPLMDSGTEIKIVSA
ncbi:PTS glucitol/sorbitol transporter subunit IIA [Heyndrickxia coagulans]|uniref:PTS glucitol/sorbitol transporter subunit IIA n=1 Tax=Heyndrickxia coagulans TaxID=1398 RepID=UPI000CE2B05E|nr:PTS glucitol/sorbitol transporter subunit IIA [Heyndrickxia coagulans]AVD55109.1 PTS sorbitol transporter subunit IIA [Heyndrickxia coagulans]